MEELDSQAFGRPVLQICKPDLITDFRAFENDYCALWSPVYVYVKIPSDKAILVHYFEDQGFRFVEFQLKMIKRLPRKKYDTSLFNEIIGLAEVGMNEDIEPILLLADESLNVDRVLLDPLVDPIVAKRRYRLYLLKSWRQENETLIRYYDKRNGWLIGFHSSLIIDAETRLGLLGATAKNVQGLGLGYGSECCLLNSWIDLGVKKFITHISLSNFNIMGVEYKALDFKPRQTFVILRKIYK